MTEEIDIFALLDAEVAKVSRKDELKKKLSQTSRAAPNRALYLPEEDRARLLTERAQVMSELNAITWRAEANAALFDRKTCACGAVHLTFLRQMQRIVTIEGPRVTRWALGTDLRADLPKEVLYQDSRSSLCTTCAVSMGFDLEHGVTKITEREWVRESFTPNFSAKLLDEEHDA